MQLHLLRFNNAQLRSQNSLQIQLDTVQEFEEEKKNSNAANSSKDMEENYKKEEEV